MNCEVCGQPFTKGQYIYEIKLDDGKIIKSHGYPCPQQVKIERKIVASDWWIRQVGIYEEDEE